MHDRTVIQISGSDAQKFLQNLVTNDVTRLKSGPIYAALLTPQGKYMADFFLIPRDDHILIDVHTNLATPLMARLTMYKLRSDVTLEQTDLIVSRGLSDAPQNAIIDPRDPRMGWRYYGETDVSQKNVDWDSVRIDLGVPEFPNDLSSESYILEMGFERLNGVDFKKGCYVGQEVTARMKHKTTLQKGLARVQTNAPLAQGQDITNTQGKPVGTVLTSSGKTALAYVRFNRSDDAQAIEKIEPLI